MASNRHDEEEEAQYARLRLLIQDAAFMRPYVKRALQQVCWAGQGHVALALCWAGQGHVALALWGVEYQVLVVLLSL